MVTITHKHNINCAIFVVQGNALALLGMIDIDTFNIITINCNTIDTQTWREQIRKKQTHGWGIQIRNKLLKHGDSAIQTLRVSLLKLEFPKYEDLQYIKANLMAQGSNILSCERKNRRGGGLACIYNERFKMKLLVPQNYQSFESLRVQWNIKSKTKLFSLIYRPPSSTKNRTPIRIFLDEFSEHITTLFHQNGDLIILGDINIPWNKEDNIDRESLLEIMDLYNLKKHVLIQTHKQGNILD